MLTTLWHSNGALSLSSKRTFAPVITSQGKDVYVAGNDGTQSVYWKNGVVAGTLSTPAGMISYATGIALSGTDVYVSGVIMYPLSLYPTTPVYWKNGTLNYLQHQTTTYNNDFWRTSGIAISGSDVYISGDNGMQCVYWKNGVAVNLSNGTFTYGITISGTDIYILGNLYTNASVGTSVAGYWKNGIPVYLPNPNSIVQSAMAIAINGTDVYVTGFISISGNLNAVYWKNGTMTTLSKVTGSGALASGIFIDASNNVYICGGENMAGQRSVAAYWRNGVETILSTQGSVVKGMVYIP